MSDDADSLFDLQSSTFRSGSGSRPPSTIVRRQSETDRLDEILETARERADSIVAESYTSAAALGNTASLARQLSQTSLDRSGDVDESSAMLNSGRPNASYDTISGGTPRSTRSRKSTYGPRSPSAVSSQLDGHAADGPAAEQRDSHLGENPDLNWQGDAEHTRDPSPSLWEKSIAPFRSIELENKGSVARDHLALERTFLAWLRTSLAFASIGVAITQLFRLNISLSNPDSNIDRGQLQRLSQPLGATFLVVSIVILMLGYRRYVNGQRWIIEGKFPASRGTIMVVVLVALSIMILSLAVVIAIQPKSE